MPELRRVTMDKKLPRKIQISASIDREAFLLLQKMASAERRSLSGELNSILYDAAKCKGFKLSVTP